MSGASAIVRSAFEIPAFHISPDDTVRLAALAGPPQGSSTSVFLEIWEPGGSQPVNSHPDSAEIFIVLKGQAAAHSDDLELVLTVGDILVLQPGSEHRIINTSTTERLYTITVMANDNGFWDLVTRGIPTSLEERDLHVLLSPASSD